MSWHRCVGKPGIAGGRAAGSGPGRTLAAMASARCMGSRARRVLPAEGALGRTGVLRIYQPVMALLLMAPLVLGVRPARAGWRPCVAGLAVLVAASANTFTVAHASLRGQQAAEEARAPLRGFPSKSVVVWGADLPFEAAYSVLGPGPLSVCTVWASSLWLRSRSPTTTIARAGAWSNASSARTGSTSSRMHPGWRCSSAIAQSGSRACWSLCWPAPMPRLSSSAGRCGTARTRAEE